MLLMMMVTAVILSTEVFAQTALPYNYIKRDNANFYFNGTEKLTSSQVLELVGEDVYNDTYKGALKQYKAGIPLMAIGSAAGLGAIVVATIGGFNLDTSLIYTGIGVAAIADAFLAGGIASFIIGRNRLDWVARNYNREQRDNAKNAAQEVSLVPAQNGIGLALRF